MESKRRAEDRAGGFGDDTADAESPRGTSIGGAHSAPALD